MFAERDVRAVTLAATGAAVKTLSGLRRNNQSEEVAVSSRSSLATSFLLG